MATVNILDALEGIISSVPEAVKLYNELVPLIAPTAEISDAQVAQINALVPTAHEAVAIASAAITDLVNTHTTSSVAAATPAGAGQPASPPTTPYPADSVQPAVGTTTIAGN